MQIKNSILAFIWLLICPFCLNDVAQSQAIPLPYLCSVPVKEGQFVSVGDFDGDGLKDLFCIRADSSVAFFGIVGAYMLHLQRDPLILPFLLRPIQTRVSSLKWEPD